MYRTNARILPLPPREHPPHPPFPFPNCQVQPCFCWDPELTIAANPPDLLLTLLQNLLVGKGDDAEYSKLTRLTSSIRQDVSDALCGGMWRMPKHLLLGETVRHVTGSAEVISPLNRFGHSVSRNALLNLRLQRQTPFSTVQAFFQLQATSRYSVCVGTTLTWTRKHFQDHNPSSTWYCPARRVMSEPWTASGITPKWSLNTSKNSCPWATGTELNSPFCCLSADTK